MKLIPKTIFGAFLLMFYICIAIGLVPIIWQATGL